METHHWSEIEQSGHLTPHAAFNRRRQHRDWQIGVQLCGNPPPPKINPLCIHHDLIILCDRFLHPMLLNEFISRHEFIIFIFISHHYRHLRKRNGWVGVGSLQLRAIITMPLSIRFKVAFKLTLRPMALLLTHPHF